MVEKKKRRTYHNQDLDQCPQKQGVCPHVLTRTPKKPNSTPRKIAKVRLNNRHDIFAHILGKGHNLQEHPIVLVRGDRVKDSPAVKYHYIRGVKDLLEIADRRRGADLNMVQKDPNRNEWKMPLERLLVEGELSSIALFNAMEALALPG